MKNIKFELVHNCAYSKKYQKNLYEYFTQCTHYKFLVYFDCFCQKESINDILFKCSIIDEIYPLIGGPITYLRLLIMIILNKNSFNFCLNSFNSKNLHLLLSIAFYSSLVQLDPDEIFKLN